MRLLQFDNKKDSQDEKALDRHHLDDVSQAYNRVFYDLKELAQKNELLKTKTDCDYQPLNPDSFLRGFTKAVEHLGTKAEIHFLDCGAGLGNILYLVKGFRDTYCDNYTINMICGIEMDKALVDFMEKMGHSLICGDMTKDVDISQFNIINYFNPLAFNRDKHNIMCAKFASDLKEGAIVMISATGLPTDLAKEYFNMINDNANGYYLGYIGLFERNSKPYQSLESLELGVPYKTTEAVSPTVVIMEKSNESIKTRKRVRKAK